MTTLEAWRRLQPTKGAACRLYDMDTRKWVRGTLVSWRNFEHGSVTVEVGDGESAIRYTVSRRRVRLIGVAQ